MENKIIGIPIWFTLHGRECIGIILMSNGFEEKAYIGKGKGENEKEDIEFILVRWGTPFPLECAKLICGRK